MSQLNECKYTETEKNLKTRKAPSLNMQCCKEIMYLNKEAPPSVKPGAKLVKKKNTHARSLPRTDARTDHLKNYLSMISEHC